METSEPPMSPSFATFSRPGDAVVSAPISPNKIRAPDREGEVVVKKDDYERDSEASTEVDMVELMGLLLPGGCLPPNVGKFSLQYSMRAFRGWVKQHSPACAAASVAGSWNALMGLGREDQGALNQDIVVEAFANMLKETIRQKRSRFERLLGAPIDELDAALRVKIAQSGKSLAGKKDEKVTKKLLVRLFKDTVIEGADKLMIPAPPDPDPDADPTATAAAAGDGSPEMVLPPVSELPEGQRAFVLFREILGPNAAVGSTAEEEEEEEDGAADADQDQDGGDEDNDGDDGDDDDDDNSAMAALSALEPEPQPEALSEDAQALRDLQQLNGGFGGFGSGGAKPWHKKKGAKKGGGKARTKGGGKKASSKGTLSGGSGGWSWRADLTALYSVIGGLEKLQRDRPSTGYFGNGNVIDGMKALSSSFPDRGCRIRPFIGKNKPKNAMEGYIKLSVKDSAATKAAQWRSLQSKFAQQDTALIFHLTNHYALIYGLREWVVEEEPLPTTAATAAAGDAAASGAEPAGAAVATPRGEEEEEDSSMAAVAAVAIPVATGSSSSERGESGESSGAVAEGASPPPPPPPPRVVRQILTTRRGQRPTTWIDWEEARGLMVKWIGYKILLVERTA